MNIYDFFNSPDVAEHCRKIGHTLNAVESAVMISQSNMHTLAEKHAAYRTLIKECPDMEIPKGCNHEFIRSFHHALEDLIDYEEHTLKAFLAPEADAVYQVSIHAKESRSSEAYELELFTRYESALDNALEYCKQEENALEEYPCLGISFTFIYMTIRKRYLNSEQYIEAKVSQAGEIIEVQHSGVVPGGWNGELDNLLNSFYIDIPIPFKRGDLVEFEDSDSWMGDVYVLKDVCRDNLEQNAQRILRGDLMDMTASVFYECGGSIECECIHFYPDLRYCRRELEGETRILKYVSLYLQDKLCLCNLLKLQKFLFLDKTVCSLKKDHNLKYDLEELGDKLLGESSEHKSRFAT